MPALCALHYEIPVLERALCQSSGSTLKSPGVPGVFSGSKGIAEMEAPVRMPAGESLGSMEGLVLRLASDGRAYSFYLRTGQPLSPSQGMLHSPCSSPGEILIPLCPLFRQLS